MAACELDPQHREHRARDLILDLEDVFDLPIIAFGPHTLACGAAHELGGNPQMITRLAYAAFEDGCYHELASDRGNIDGLAFEGKRRRPGDHVQSRSLGEQINEFLGKTIGKVFLVLLFAHVEKGQHGDGSFSDQLRRGTDRACYPFGRALW